MVKATLSKRPQTTTIAFGNGHARWAMEAYCNDVMLLIDGELTACHICGKGILNVETGELVRKARIYRATVTQIRNILSHE